MDKIPRITIDTNVFVAALKSRRGASYKLLLFLDRNLYTFVVSVPVMMEYEDVLKRKDLGIKIPDEKIDNLLDRVAYLGEQREIYFLWRPYLKDPKDDLFLELAVKSNCDYIITYNKSDFAGIDKFSIQVLTPKEFLVKAGII